MKGDAQVIIDIRIDCRIQAIGFIDISCCLGFGFRIQVSQPYFKIQVGIVGIHFLCCKVSLQRSFVFFTAVMFVTFGNKGFLILTRNDE